MLQVGRHWLVAIAGGFHGNVVLTPHIAGVSAGVLRKVGAVVLADLRAVLDGRLPTHLVNASHAQRIAQRWRSLDAQRNGQDKVQA